MCFLRQWSVFVLFAIRPVPLPFKVELWAQVEVIHAIGQLFRVLCSFGITIQALPCIFFALVRWSEYSHDLLERKQEIKAIGPQVNNTWLDF